MKANRLAKDKEGVEASDAIIILALILGLALVAVYIGHAIGGWGGGVVTVVKDWFGGVGAGIQEGVVDTESEIMEHVTIPAVSPFLVPAVQFWDWITGTDRTIIKVSDDFLAAMWNEDYFTLQNEENESDTLKGIISSFEGNTTRRYTLTNETGRSAVEEIFRLRGAKTLMIDAEFFERIRLYSIGEILTLEGDHYNATITGQRDDAEVEQWLLEITKS